MCKTIVQVTIKNKKIIQSHCNPCFLQSKKLIHYLGKDHSLSEIQVQLYEVNNFYLAKSSHSGFGSSNCVHSLFQQSYPPIYSQCQASNF